MRIFFILCITLSLFSCNKNTLENDIAKINSLHKELRYSVGDSVLPYLKECENIIAKHNKIPDSIIIENVFRKGYYYLLIENLDSAAYYFHRTIDQIDKSNISKRNRIYFQNTWQNDEKINNRTNAISVAQKFIDLSKNNNNTNDLLFGFNAMERLHLDIGNLKKSLEYNSLASKAALDVGDIDMFVLTKTSRATRMYEYLGEKKQAFQLLDSLKPIGVVTDTKRQLFRGYGILNYYEGNYDEAITYYELVIALSKKVNPKNLNYNLLESYNNIAEAYIEAKRYPLAKKYLDSSKATINSSSFPDYIMFYNELSFKYNYRTKSNEQELLDEYLALIAENNKQHQRKINEELTQLHLANEKEQVAVFQKNEADIENLKLYITLGVLAVLMILGYLFYRQRRFKFETESLQMQQRLLRSQMNPHFIFNTLSVIQNQIKENKDEAVNYLLKFSRLLRLILENSLSDYVLVEDELESLRKYLDLQLVRFPEKFSYTISLENFVEDDLMFIPPMLIQPFVENSIEHGFLGINYKGEIDIKLSLKDKWISCQINDNGVGLNETNSNLKNSVSIQLITKFIKKTTHQNINIQDKKRNSQNASGVLVSFLIPFKF